MGLPSVRGGCHSPHVRLASRCGIWMASSSSSGTRSDPTFPGSAWGASTAKSGPRKLESGTMKYVCGKCKVNKIEDAYPRAQLKTMGEEQKPTCLSCCKGIGQFEMQPVREGEACRKFSSLHGHNAQGTRSLHSMPGGGCEKADIKPHSVVYVSRLPAGAQRRFWHGPRSEPEMHELRFQGHKTEGRANMSQQGLQAQVPREAGAGSGEKSAIAPACRKP